MSECHIEKECQKLATRRSLSAAFCPFIPTLIKPDSLLRLNAVWTITQHGKEAKSQGRRMVSTRPANLSSCRRRRTAKCAGEGDGGGGRRTGYVMLFVPKYALEGEEHTHFTVEFPLVCPDRNIHGSRPQRKCENWPYQKP